MKKVKNDIKEFFVGKAEKKEKYSFVEVRLPYSSDFEKEYRKQSNTGGWGLLTVILAIITSLILFLNNYVRIGFIGGILATLTVISFLKSVFEMNRRRNIIKKYYKIQLKHLKSEKN